jgi:uncharacterized protein (DUF58 family)
MITARGWWFLVVVLSVLTLGAFSGRLMLTLVALTLLLWFLGEWFIFFVRVHWTLPTLRVRRELSDDRGPVTTLWAGRSFRANVQICSTSGLGLPWLRITEFIPFGAEKTEGSTERDAALSADGAVTLEYKLRCPTPGLVRFEGITVQMADFQGLFYFSRFVQSAAIYRVLPPLADVEGHRPTVKRRNLLPAPGLHRHLRPGSGSELLDLRDYIPGDPPKTIAWKVSARRDRLITKEFESEVPIRCTLFVDTSQSVRIGAPGSNALARIVEISAAVAQASAGVRDLTGLCLFDGHRTVRYLRPARGARHLVQVLNLLTDAAGLAPATGRARYQDLLPIAYAYATEVYPHLLQPEINSAPGWLPWFWPKPDVNRERPFIFARLGRWTFFALVSAPFVIAGFLAFLFADLLTGEAFTSVLSALLPVPRFVLALVGIGLLVSLLVLYYPVAGLLFRMVRRFFSPGTRRLGRWRKCLAALLAERYRLGPGGLAQLLEDNEQFALWVQRFLAEHHVPYALPLYDRRGEYLFASPGKIEVLARALLRAISRVRDNELFVLLVDLMELSDRLDPLLRAVKVTLARHHRVLLICPWPPGVPPPPVRSTVRPEETPAPWSAGGAAVITQLTATRLRRAFHRLRRRFGKMGVPVVCAASGDPVRLILARVNQLRSVGTGRR